MLTKQICEEALPKEKPYKLAHAHGLYLYVTPRGTKFWRMKYRLNKKEQTYCIGEFPLIELDEAIREANEVRKLLYVKKRTEKFKILKKRVS